jgi:hypothetical protein
MSDLEELLLMMEREALESEADHHDKFIVSQTNSHESRIEYYCMGMAIGKLSAVRKIMRFLDTLNN